MKIIETTFERLPRERLVIGFEGENQRSTVRIDSASVFAEYPNATPALIVKPLFADAYPVVVDRNGTCVDWLITSEILSFSGDGEIQLVFYKDEVICKSAVSKIRVCRSLQVTGDMPDPIARWVDDANRKLAEVDAQIVELEGMVDTATDAATRAEQSASTASTKAEQAAESAATATEKATEATNAAGTATAKAAEAEQSALTATNKATAAAESERIATAKAGDATTAAGTATAKAGQATEAAQTATEKAGDASASATAAHASEINAAESADDALSAEVGANAAKRAAETSATQAGISEQNAGTAAQTATQKATEATQSATDAATFAGTATTKAEEAAQSAQAASDAKTAVEQTAEQLADSLEQIEQNTQDIAELDERKANVDGYYPDMTVGNAEQLNSSKYVENSEPYTLRTSGGTSDIGNREYLDAVVGGTVAWNQMVRDEASENSTDFAPIVTVTDAVEDAAGVKVKIEPVQDLHGYDHPWPGGGGKNLLGSKESKTLDVPTANSSFTFEKDSSQVTFTTSGLSSSLGYRFNDIDLKCTLPAGTYYFSSNISNQNPGSGLFVYNADTSAILARARLGEGTRFALSDTTTIRLGASLSVSTASGTYWFQLESGSTATSYEPYSNICPITGWTAAKVTRTGKNLCDESNLLLAEGWTVTDGVYSGINTALHIAFSNGFPGMAFKPDTTYTVSLVFRSTTASKITVIGFNYTDGTHSELYVQDTVEHTVSFTSTSGKSVSNLLLSYGSGDKVYISQMQVEEGSTASDYEPYAGNTYDITLPTEAGTVYGGTLDVSTGELVVDRATVDLGTLNWVIQTHYSVNRFGAPVSGMTKATSTPYYKNIMCSAYKPSNVPITTVNENGTIGRYNGWIYICDAQFSDVATFKEAVSGVQFVYELATPVEISLTPTEIRTLLGTNNVWADTGDVALTYTGTDEHLTLESGKKYLARLSGTDSMLLGSGQEITAAKGTDNVFDLTQMFGTAVADYVYGQGAAFFRKWFPNAVYPYNAGELKHVEELQSHDMVGFNLWDEEWEKGDLNLTTGEPTASNSSIRSKNFVPVLPNTSYYFKGVSSTGFWTMFYDADKNVISDGLPSGIQAVSNARKLKNNEYTMPTNCHYIKFYLEVTYGTTYNHDICISLAHNGSRNGEYAPYEKHSYPLDSSVILRGIPKVGANGVYWDGDRYLPDGTVERKYGVVDMGALNWAYGDNSGRWGHKVFYADVSGRKVASAYICGKYTYSNISISSETFPDKSYGVSSNSYAYIRDDSFTDPAAFKSAMQGVLLVYELATPTTETAQPYHSTQWVSDWGTEEFVSTGIVPVGSETRYPANLRDKLQHLPDAASGNGSYLITQTDGQMVLTPFPAPPSTAGNYVLKATVVNGVATYTWEVAT